MEIDISRIIISTINFLILYLILRHYLFNPVNNILEAREKNVSEKITKAAKDKEEAEILRADSEKAIKLAKTEGKRLLEDYKAKAENVSQEIIAEAKKEAMQVMERARIEVEREREKARHELQAEVVDVALMLSSRALSESLDEKMHRELIKDFILKVGS